eukprot:symbB.v1.2.014356.t1/scaffold1049.1/size141829/3
MSRTRFACVPFGTKLVGHSNAGGKLPEAQVEKEPREAESFLDVMTDFAKSSGAADAWKAWMEFTSKYCKCTG